VRNRSGHHKKGIGASAPQPNQTLSPLSMGAQAKNKSRRHERAAPDIGAALGEGGRVVRRSRQPPFFSPGGLTKSKTVAVSVKLDSDQVGEVGDPVVDQCYPDHANKYHAADYL
jgi:hypothetical protein